MKNLMNRNKRISYLPLFIFSPMLWPIKIGAIILEDLSVKLGDKGKILKLNKEIEKELY
jgi:hypothetical protein